MNINFLLFVALCELVLVLVIVVIVQSLYLKKYKPYFMANTRPEIFLRKYIQYLIKHTQKFTRGFDKAAKNGDATAIKTRQQMTARLNWLVLERDFAITTHPDIRYWEDLNARIKDMLEHWKEVEFIKAPPDLESIKLAIDGNPEEFDFENSDVDQAIKDQIQSLQKKAKASSTYESMYKEMEMAYRTSDANYKSLKETINGLNVESGETDKLKVIIAEQEANEKHLNAMMSEIEKSKERLVEELKQLEDAFVEMGKGAENKGTLQDSENPDAKEILSILAQQQTIFDEFRKTLKTLNMKPSQKIKVDEHTNNMEKTHKEINHSMQMLELERERLELEVRQMQESLEDQSSNSEESARSELLQ